MQGRSLCARVQYDRASALGLSQPECVADEGMLRKCRKCRGDYFIHYAISSRGGGGGDCLRHMYLHLQSPCGNKKGS